ncbi:MAG: FAD-dependent oxidoreductase, partial [Elusimicrobia bacterium]|nr:FAD-dependent oxidoreductase [Elusimicrobiota bacterium]
GGCAGLAAATALATSGARDTVLEKKPHLGGRAFSFTAPRAVEIVDIGQHLFMACYRETRSFLERIGSGDLLRFSENARVVFADAEGQRAVLDCPNWPAPFGLGMGILGLGGLGVMDKAGLLRLGAWFQSTMRGGRGWPRDLDLLTVREWLDGLGQSRRLQERLFDPIAIGALNELPEKASALGMAQVMAEVFFRDPSGSRLGVATVGLSDLYVEQSRRFIEERGGRVLCGVKAAAIRLDGRARVETERSGTFEGEAVVGALPPNALAALDLPSELRGGWDRLGFAPIIGINLWLDRPVIEGPLVGLLGTDLHWAFNKNDLWGKKDAGQYLALVISGAHAHVGKSPQELYELAVRDLNKCLPESAKAKVLRWTVVKEPQATISPLPGTDALRPAHASPNPRFFFAGDWTQTGLPATIESACASGHACASLIATSRGKKATISA